MNLKTMILALMLCCLCASCRDGNKDSIESCQLSIAEAQADQLLLYIGEARHERGKQREEATAQQIRLAMLMCLNLWETLVSTAEHLGIASDVCPTGCLTEVNP